MATKGMTDEFRTTEVTVRGVTYKFREVSANEYDEVLKLAAGPDDNADLATVLKILAVKSIIEPQISGDELGAKPLAVYNKLLQAVNKLNFQADDESGESPND